MIAYHAVPIRLLLLLKFVFPCLLFVVVAATTRKCSRKVHFPCSTVTKMIKTIAKQPLIHVVIVAVMNVMNVVNIDNSICYPGWIVVIDIIVVVVAAMVLHMSSG